MNELPETIKIVAEVAIAAITALGTVWGALRQSRQDVRSSTTDAFKVMMADLNQERDELVELLRRSHQENLELQKELAATQRGRGSAKPPGG
jgi:nuclear transport factor 2 (NTF2) superfamily protein